MEENLPVEDIAKAVSDAVTTVLSKRKSPAESSGDEFESLPTRLTNAPRKKR